MFSRPACRYLYVDCAPVRTVCRCERLQQQAWQASSDTAADSVTQQASTLAALTGTASDQLTPAMKEQVRGPVL